MKRKDNTEKVRKPIFKRWWFWLIIAVILASALFSGGSDSKTQEDQPQIAEAQSK